MIVNRVWHHHFGCGIVATTSDFGIRGSKPSHLTFRHAGRDFRLTDVHGRVVNEILA
ncbi:MAG TPA: DUF1553 domain-containing protein [Pirellula sp.]|nr:DUF1553 domain-containing protein [Pirellula sp.]